MRAYLLAALGLASLSLGCAREHLSPGFGRATRQTFALQQGVSSKQGRPASTSLDTQEAAVISQAYVQSLAKEAPKEPAPIVLVSPQKGQGQAQQLMPSVPRNP